MFEIGLNDYLTTEEGLALIMEEMNNILSKNRQCNYAGRVLATSLVQKPFYKIIEELLLFFDRSEAFQITHRVKRGLEDTGKPGGFTKDYVYLLGYSLLKEFLDNGGKLEQLYIGKISTIHVRVLWPLVEKGVLKRPLLLPNFLKNNL